jgi:hypothetical protein
VARWKTEAEREVYVKVCDEIAAQYWSIGAREQKWNQELIGDRGRVAFTDAKSHK